MPKRSDEDMTARRQHILAAARRCFSDKGFAGTTILDIARAAKVSSGNLYTHFSSKKEMLEAITSSVSAPDFDGEIDLLALFDLLQSPQGGDNARLDLNLWSEATRDSEVHALVSESMNHFRGNLRKSLPHSQRSVSFISLLEALTLGLEVQRSLGRKAPHKRQLRQLLEEE